MTPEQIEQARTKLRARVWLSANAEMDSPDEWVALDALVRFEVLIAKWEEGARTSDEVATVLAEMVK